MASDPPPSAPETEQEVSFPVSYQQRGLAEYNRELKGEGVLTVAADSSVFRFTGRKRTLFSAETVTIEFSGEEICDVEVAGNLVRFGSGRTSAGKSQPPFMFFCASDHDAAMIGALLPARVDVEFAATQTFYERLQGLPAHRHPFTSVTNLIIAINCLVFLVMAGVLGAGWIEVTNLTPYVLYGANNGSATTMGEWWRLLTAMFLHYGLLHLALNMWALLQAGHLLERLQGRLLFAITYLTCGVGGGIATLCWSRSETWSAGASGAVFGVYGAVVGYMLKEKQAFPRTVFMPMLTSTLTFAGYNLFYGMVHPGIDNAAHIGGLVTGLLLGWLTAMPLELSARSSQLRSRMLLALAMLATIGVGGYVAAPRPDYYYREEMNWEEALKGFDEKEQQLLNRQNAENTRYAQTRDNAESWIALLEAELMPMYRDVLQRLDALELTPGLATEKRRARITEFIRLRLESYQHLARALRTSDEREFQLFQEFTRKADAVNQAT